MSAVPAAYAELSEADQVEILRPVAARAAAAFGLEATRTELVAHAYNTTFAVRTADGRRVALRVGTSSLSRPSDVVAQQTWQVAIGAQTDVLVPRPLTTTGGEWLVEVECPALGRPLVVTAADWLDGPDIGDLEADDVAAGALGRTMALLHRQGRIWRLPDGATMPERVVPLFGDTDVLDAAPLTGSQREVLDAARRATERAYAALLTGTAPHPIHADLHGANLKWRGNRLVVFDFDDCGLGTPAVDLAIASFYLRGSDPAPERAFRAAYTTLEPWPTLAATHFEALVADRQLLLLNTLLASTTASWRAQALRYLDDSIDRLRHWLATGTFTRAVPRPGGPD